MKRFLIICLLAFSLKSTIFVQTPGITGKIERCALCASLWRKNKKALIPLSGTKAFLFLSWRSGLST